MSVVDISPQEAWSLLSSDRAAQLVDVRTKPEWDFVGVPALSSIEKECIYLSWKLYPTMEINDTFISTLLGNISDKSVPLLFLCKIGGRSKQAAEAASAIGFSQTYNILGGFEGELNEASHRGLLNGWKYCQLPWIQT